MPVDEKLMREVWGLHIPPQRGWSPNQSRDPGQNGDSYQLVQRVRSAHEKAVELQETVTQVTETMPQDTFMGREQIRRLREQMASVLAHLQTALSA